MPKEKQELGTKWKPKWPNKGTESSRKEWKTKKQKDDEPYRGSPK
jgi:hypothetical protein